jgi:ubiquinone/menaquinone biosynthesis C-methylase UbiE
MKASRSATAARFDAWAGDYDSGRWSRWFRALQDIAIRHVDHGRCRAVLDVGCGTGWAVRTLAERDPEVSARGLDVSPLMIEHARRAAYGLPNIEFEVGDAQSIPFPDDSFDAVLCTNSFPHYAYPDRAMQEMTRVARSGGMLLVLDSMRDQFLPIRLLDLVNRAFERSHVRYPSGPEMERCFRQAGIVDVERLFTKSDLCWEGKLVTGVTLWKAIAP